MTLLLLTCCCLPTVRCSPHCGIVFACCSRILTHDFTDRVHMEIFPSYYPAALSDWWMDDWISRVYGRKRTRKLLTVTVGHTLTHGTRYRVDRSHGKLLDSEIRKGRHRIHQFMVKHEYPQAVMDQFLHDRSDYEVGSYG